MRSAAIVVALAIQAAAQMPAGQAVADPLYRTKGDHARAYWFSELNAKQPYRIYVPSTWTPEAKFPLIVVLHGAGLDENAPFDRAPANLKGILTKLAEERGYIVAAVNGLGAAYGSHLLIPKKLFASPSSAPRPPGRPPVKIAR